VTGPQIAVGAIVIDDGRLLMVQRANDPGKGLWSLPGGRVEHGEFIADAVARELFEETGLTVGVGELAGILEVPGDLHYVILDYHAVLTSDATEVRAGDDVGDVRWVPLNEVARMDCTPRFVETMRAWSVLTDDE
jgi:mutator protein MutT